MRAWISLHKLFRRDRWPFTFQSLLPETSVTSTPAHHDLNSLAIGRCKFSMLQNALLWFQPQSKLKSGKQKWTPMNGYSALLRRVIIHYYWNKFHSLFGATTLRQLYIHAKEKPKNQRRVKDSLNILKKCTKLFFREIVANKQNLVDGTDKQPYWMNINAPQPIPQEYVLYLLYNARETQVPQKSNTHCAASALTQAFHRHRLLEFPCKTILFALSIFKVHAGFHVSH